MLKESSSARFLLEMANLGIFVSRAIAQAVGDEVTSNVSVLILCTLALDGPKRPTELMEVVGLSSGGMTKAIDRLELQKLTARTPDPKDRRALLVDVTPHGSDIVERLLQAYEAAITSDRARVERLRAAINQM